MKSAVRSSRNIRVGRAAALLLVVLVARQADSHHAPALYDSDHMIAIEGRLVSYEHRNPHTRMILDVPGQSGVPVRWTVSMPPPQAINSKGFAGRLTGLKPGAPVRVRGWPHFVNDNEMRSYKVYLEGDEMLQMVFNNNFRHKDQIRIEEYLENPAELAGASDSKKEPRERVTEWVIEDDHIRRVAVEYNAGQALFIGLDENGDVEYPGIEDHLACLPARTDAMLLRAVDADWWREESVVRYISAYNDMLARYLETSLVTCGE